MDCVQALLWLIKSQKDPGATVADGTDQAWRPPTRDVTWALLKADVTEAHRRIKVTKEGWKYQVAQLNVGGSTRLVPMAWPVPSSTGADWRHYYSGNYIFCFPEWTGALSLWMTFVDTWLGFLMNPTGPIVQISQDKNQSWRLFSTNSLAALSSLQKRLNELLAVSIGPHHHAH